MNFYDRTRELAILQDNENQKFEIETFYILEVTTSIFPNR